MTRIIRIAGPSGLRITPVGLQVVFEITGRGELGGVILPISLITTLQHPVYSIGSYLRLSRDESAMLADALEFLMAEY